MSKNQFTGTATQPQRTSTVLHLVFFDGLVQNYGTVKLTYNRMLDYFVITKFRYIYPI